MIKNGLIVETNVGNIQKVFEKIKTWEGILQ